MATSLITKPSAINPFIKKRWRTLSDQELAIKCNLTVNAVEQLPAARLGKFAQRTPKITSIFKVRAHRKPPRARIQQAQLDKCAVTHASAALRVVRAVVQPRPPVAETGARVQLFDAARLLPRSRKTPAMGHAWATSIAAPAPRRS